jgi:hypothetical protein
VAHFKSEHGKFFVGPTADGPWKERVLVESRQRPKPSRKKGKPIMGKSESGFDRALREESEKRRRRKVREAEEVARERSAPLSSREGCRL